MPGELLRTDVGDLTFDVRVDGPEDGRPVLLLHGFPETSASWAAVTPLLTEAGLRTYAVDQLGYSPGARPAEVEAYALPNLAQVTADLMTALDVPRADVVGHDWGANVAWALAAWHPDRVRSLTAVSVPHPAAFTAAWRADPEQRRRITARAYEDLIENNCRRSTLLEEIAQRLYREWFVHFRFPGHERVAMVESEVGPIPEGWALTQLGATGERIRHVLHAHIARGRPNAASRDASGARAKQP